VAPLGTAVTEGQLERLWKMADVPILCFDGDAAGQKAAIRAAQRALPMIEPGRSLAFVTLPPGQDPDDLARSGGRTAFDALLGSPEPLVDRLCRFELAAEPLETPEARAGLRQRLGDLTGAIGNPAVREQYRIEYRNRFDGLFSRSPERRPFNQFRRNDARRPWAQPARPVSSNARSIGKSGIEQMVARAIICGLIRYPLVIGEHAEAIAMLTFPDAALGRVRDVLLDAAFEKNPLERAEIETILENAGLKAAMEAILAPNGLAFSFMRSNADSERARRDLAAAVEAVAIRPELDAALAAATERLKTSPDEAGFAEQRRLSAARAEADRSLAALVGNEDGSGL
jgi:DNA primase